MTWQVEFLDEALNDLRKLDGSVKLQVLKGICKVSQNPLPTNQGGYGKPLGILLFLLVQMMRYINKQHYVGSKTIYNKLPIARVSIISYCLLIMTSLT